MDGFFTSEYPYAKDKFNLVFFPKGPSAKDYVSLVNRDNFYVVPRTAADTKASAAILRLIVAYSSGYDQVMESYKNKDENDYNTLLLAGEKVLYKEIQDTLIGGFLFKIEYSIIHNLLGSQYPTANNLSSFDFKNYVKQSSEEIQPKLDEIWNIPMNSDE